MAKKLIVATVAVMWALNASAQRIDSIYFNLYTDSLKKGTYNYINVEGRFTDGHYLPLGERELRFSASAGQFSGNSLFIDTSFHGESVIVKAVLLTDTSFSRQTTIYIKKSGENARLPTVDEILRKPLKASR